MTPLSDRKYKGKLAQGPPNSPDSASNFQRRKSSASLAERYAITVSPVKVPNITPSSKQPNEPINLLDSPINHKPIHSLSVPSPLSKPLESPSKPVVSTKPASSPNNKPADSPTLSPDTQPSHLESTLKFLQPMENLQLPAKIEDSPENEVVKPSKLSPSTFQFDVNKLKPASPHNIIASPPEPKPADRPRKTQPEMSPKTSDKVNLPTIPEIKDTPPKKPKEKSPRTFPVAPAKLASLFGGMSVAVLALGLNSYTLPLFVAFVFVLLYYVYVETRLPRPKPLWMEL